MLQRILKHGGRDQMAAFCKRHFRILFRVLKQLPFYLIFPKMRWQWSYYQRASIVLDNGLASNRLQAIIWTKASLLYRFIYTLLGLADLTKWAPNTVYSLKDFSQI